MAKTVNLPDTYMNHLSQHGLHKVLNDLASACDAIASWQGPTDEGHAVEQKWRSIGPALTKLADKHQNIGKPFVAPWRR